MYLTEVLSGLCSSHRTDNWQNVKFTSKMTLLKRNARGSMQLLRSNGTTPLYPVRGWPHNTPEVYGGTKIWRPRKMDDNNKLRSMVSLSCIDYMTSMKAAAIRDGKIDVELPSTAAALEQAKLASETKVQRTLPVGMSQSSYHTISVRPLVSVSYLEEEDIIESIILDDVSKLTKDVLEKRKKILELGGHLLTNAFPSSIEQTVKEFTRPKVRTVRGPYAPTEELVRIWNTNLSGYKWFPIRDEPSEFDITKSVNRMFSCIFLTARNGKLAKDAVVRMVQQSTLLGRPLKDYWSPNLTGNGPKLWTALKTGLSYRQTFHFGTIGLTIVKGNGLTRVTKIKIFGGKTLNKITYRGGHKILVNIPNLGSALITLDGAFFVKALVSCDNLEIGAEILNTAVAALTLVTNVAKRSLPVKKTGLEGWKEALAINGLEINTDGYKLIDPKKRGIIYSSELKKFTVGQKWNYVDMTPLEPEVVRRPCFLDVGYNLNFDGVSVHVPLSTERPNLEHRLPGIFGRRSIDDFESIVNLIITTGAWNVLSSQMMLRDFSNILLVELERFADKTVKIGGQLRWIVDNQPIDVLDSIVIGMYVNTQNEIEKPDDVVVVPTPCGNVIYGKNEEGTYVSDMYFNQEEGVARIGTQFFNFNRSLSKINTMIALQQSALRRIKNQEEEIDRIIYGDDPEASRELTKIDSEQPSTSKEGEELNVDEGYDLYSDEGSINIEQSDESEIFEEDELDGPSKAPEEELETDEEEPEMINLPEDLEDEEVNKVDEDPRFRKKARDKTDVPLEIDEDDMPLFSLEEGEQPYDPMEGWGEPPNEEVDDKTETASFMDSVVSGENVEPIWDVVDGQITATPNLISRSVVDLDQPEEVDRIVVAQHMDPDVVQTREGVRRRRKHKFEAEISAKVKSRVLTVEDEQIEIVTLSAVNEELKKHHGVSFQDENPSTSTAVEEFARKRFTLQNIERKRKKGHEFAVSKLSTEGMEKIATHKKEKVNKFINAFEIMKSIGEYQPVPDTVKAAIDYFKDSDPDYYKNCRVKLGLTEKGAMKRKAVEQLKLLQKKSSK